MQDNITSIFAGQSGALNEKALRQRCHELCDQFPGLPRLRTIAAVGALTEPNDAGIVLSHRDSMRMNLTLGYLLKSGFLIDPDFEIDAVNFREGRNFLDEDKPADLIYVAYILRDMDRFTKKFERYGVPEDECELIEMLSARHFPEEWTDRARQAGAKMIFTYGGRYEIHAGYFQDNGADQPYTVLIESPWDECAGGFDKGELKAQYPDYKGIDVPLVGLGFSADENYLRATAPSINSTTCLGRMTNAVLHPEPQNKTTPSTPRFQRYRTGWSVK